MCNKNVTTREIQVHGPFKKEEEEEEETKNFVRSFVSFSFKKNKRTTISSFYLNTSSRKHLLKSTLRSFGRSEIEYTSNQLNQRIESRASREFFKRHVAFYFSFPPLLPQWSSRSRRCRERRKVELPIARRLAAARRTKEGRRAKEEATRTGGGSCVQKREYRRQTGGR